MATRKYLKFGLRADKNLSDLTDTNVALTNIINDLTSVNDINGVPTGFRLTDIEPLFYFASSDLDETYDYTNPETPPYALSRLKGTRATSTVIREGKSKLEKVVEPQVRIQDYLDRYKTVFGNPPFANGGSGPDGYFVPTDRTNQNSNYDQIGDVISGNNMTGGSRYKIMNAGSVSSGSWTAIGSGSSAVGTIFTANTNGGTAYSSATVRNVTEERASFKFLEENVAPEDLKAGYLYTYNYDQQLTPIHHDPDYWNQEGFFTFDDRIHETFPDENGVAQFTGYQDGAFGPQIETNALYLLEEDTTEDETDETNWRVLKGSLQPVIRPVHNASWETDADEGVTIITLDPEDSKKIGLGMVCRITDPNFTSVDADIDGENALEGYVMSVSDDSVTLDIDLGVTGSGDDITFSFNIGEDLIRYYGMGDMTPVLSGKRRRVRYTFYWPEGSQSTQGPKSGGEISDLDFGYQFWYKEQATQDFSNKKNSFVYFRDNKASPTLQESDYELKVKTSLGAKYLPKTESVDITLPGLNSTGSLISTYTLNFTNLGQYNHSYGLYPNDPIVSISQGDYIVCANSAGNQYYAFQVLDAGIGLGGSGNENFMFLVDQRFSAVTGHADETDVECLILKNAGLAGIFGSNGSTNDAYKIGVGTGAKSFFAEELAVDDMLYKIDFGFSESDNATCSVNKLGYRVISTDHDNARGTNSTDFDVEYHPDHTGGNIPSGGGILVNYRSKGLLDRSTIAECSGVFGKEVTTLANTGSTTISVSDTNGISNGDYVYYEGIVPAGATVQGTTSTTVTISASTTNAVLIAGATLVFVKSDAGPDSDGWGGLNKEYCVLPLNTAPPWDGTPVGLKSPDASPNVVTKEFRFSKMSITLPTNCITETPDTTTDNYLTVTYTDPSA